MIQLYFFGLEILTQSNFIQIIREKLKQNTPYHTLLTTINKIIFIDIDFQRKLNNEVSKKQFGYNKNELYVVLMVIVSSCKAPTSVDRNEIFYRRQRKTQDIFHILLYIITATSKCVIQLLSHEKNMYTFCKLYMKHNCTVTNFT